MVIAYVAANRFAVMALSPSWCRCLCPALAMALQDSCGENGAVADNFLQKTAKTAPIAFREASFV
jgi:hypothetical protein